MLLQSMTILAALVFVLGLVAVAVWVAKRFGAIRTSPHARVAIEVVQRVSLGPKTGLAVVRVGEKVMAVSMGPDGMRPLFELDEADRQRVVASSTTATPFASSVDAHRALGRMLPPAFARMFQRHRAEAPLSFADSMRSALHPKPPAATMPTISATPEPVSAGERDFRSVLNIAMSGATRLAVLVGAVALSAAGAHANLGAQAAPPATGTPPVVTTPVTVTTAGADTNPVAIAQPATQPSTTPTPPVATQPAFIPAPGQRTTRTAPIRPAPVRAPATLPAGTAGNQSSAADSAARAPARKPTSTVLPGTAARGSNRATKAQTAPVAGGDEALANLLPQMDIKMGDGKDGGLRLSGTVGIVVMMGLMTLIPTLVLMMTGFTRILIVLHFLKQAMGTQSAPPAQLLAAMALLLTGFVMAPTLTEVNEKALTPWMDGRMTQVEMLKEGVKPMRVFMMKQTREEDLRTFIELSRLPRPNSIEDVPLHVLTSAFVASELRRAFQIGFMVYLPFIIIDAVVASVLMSMGMFMLPPAMISMPFKLLLFVLVDGWGLIIQELVKSFK